MAAWQAESPLHSHGRNSRTISTTAFTLTDKSSLNRYTVGVRLSLFLPKLVVEATQAEVRSYAAKVSIGF